MEHLGKLLTMLQPGAAITHVDSGVVISQMKLDYPKWKALGQFAKRPVDHRCVCSTKTAPVSRFLKPVLSEWLKRCDLVASSKSINTPMMLMSSAV